LGEHHINSFGALPSVPPREKRPPTEFEQSVALSHTVINYFDIPSDELFKLREGHMVFDNLRSVVFDTSINVSEMDTNDKATSPAQWIIGRMIQARQDEGATIPMPEQGSSLKDFLRHFKTP
jgi:hypothetical protein